MSVFNYKPEILINDRWMDNDQVFATRLEAEYAAFYMMDGCMEACDWRAVETMDPVNAVTTRLEPPEY